MFCTLSFFTIRDPLSFSCFFFYLFVIIILKWVGSVMVYIYCLVWVKRKFEFISIQSLIAYLVEFVFDIRKGKKVNKSKSKYLICVFKLLLLFKHMCFIIALI